MKRIVLFALFAASLSALAIDPNVKTAVLNGSEGRECIVYTPNANTNYIAESAPGSSATQAVWLCTKIIELGATYPYTKEIKVLPYLGTPGVGGTNLPALFGN